MKTNSNTVVNQSITLSGRDIVKLLNKAGIFNDGMMDIPTKVVFKVPRGGDYSGMDVDFDNEELVQVSWTTSTTLNTIKDF